MRPDSNLNTIIPTIHDINYNFLLLIWDHFTKLYQKSNTKCVEVSTKVLKDVTHLINIGENG